MPFGALDYVPSPRKVGLEENAHALCMSQNWRGYLDPVNPGGECRKDQLLCVEVAGQQRNCSA